MKNHVLLLPPRDEQDVLVDWIESAVVIVDRAVARVKAEIRLIHEYQTRLIADVVTGKLDVRAVAASLADESEGPDAIEEVDSPAEGDEEASAGQYVEQEAAEA